MKTEEDVRQMLKIIEVFGDAKRARPISRIEMKLIDERETRTRFE